MNLPTYRGWTVVEVEEGTRFYVVGADRAFVFLAYRPDGTAAVCPTRVDFRIFFKRVRRSRPS